MGLNPFSKESFVGIDIGSYSIKTVLMDQSRGGWSVTKFASCPTPSEAVRDGVIVDIESVAEALREMLNENHIGATTANVAVAGSSVIVRSVKLPKMSEANLRKSIRFEAGKYVPSSIEDSYIEFDILGEADDGKMDVLVVAAPKEMVEARIAAVRGAGLDTEVVDIEGFALYRAVVEAPRASEYEGQTIAMIDMGASHTHISVVSDGAFSLTRSIPIAGGTLTEALHTYFRTDAQAGEATKRELDWSVLAGADTSAGDNSALKLLQPIVDELVREIRRSINYYQTQHTDIAAGSPVTSILLSGGASAMKGIDTYLGFKLALPCNATGVWSVGDYGIVDFEEDPGYEFGVAAGLAMRRASRVAVAA